MKNSASFIWIAICILVIFACNREDTPEQLFEKSKSKYHLTEYYQYQTTLFWQNPLMDEIDTFQYQLFFEKFPNDHFFYNYIGFKDNGGFYYIDNVFSEIHQRDSSIFIFTEEQLERERYIIDQNMLLGFSPINMLREDDFAFQKDTAISGKQMRKYIRVKLDTLIEDIHAYLEHQIFINPANAEIPLIKTLLYHNGEERQVIEVTVEQQQFSDQSPGLINQLPKGFVTKIKEDERNRLHLLTKGNPAPNFELEDLEGNKISLKDYLGKRVFIDFSIINCGWCKIAIDEFNKPDFKFADDVIPLYINPLDTKERMMKYNQKTNIPFPILTNAKEIGEAYGVNGYPSFFIIDEKGIIVESFSGFNEDLIGKIRER